MTIQKKEIQNPRLDPQVVAQLNALYRLIDQERSFTSPSVVNKARQLAELLLSPAQKSA